MDKEKVFKGMNCCLRNGDPECCLCPYDAIDLRCRVNLRNDLINLMKAQEPVEPVFERQFLSRIEIYDCGKCGTSLGAKGIAKYCMNCGQAVKWE